VKPQLADDELELIRRRGLVGMANSGKRNTNTSQFFFTLDKADELTNKHTMFGKVVGNTIYSMSLFLGFTINGWK
jgi:cyclophilin family peptidyl-prolyl cis-trans isomerase